MPTVKFVNALDSFAGGLAGGLQSAQERKRQDALDAERMRRADIEEADNNRRLTIAEQDQAMQADAQKRAQAAQEATQQAFAIGANAAPTPFKSRLEAMRSVLPKVDPRFADDVVKFAERRDLADHTVSQIQNDLSSGLFDDVQAGPDGKEQRVPNPVRQASVSKILEDLNNGADPENALQRLTELRAPIIGQRIQVENKARAIQSAQKQLEDSYGQGIDISEATSLFHHMSNEIDPKEWLRDPLNRAQWDAALKGYALVPDSEGKATMVHPDDRDRFVRMVYDAKQAMAEAEQWKSAYAKAQAAFAEARPGIEATNADARKKKAEADLYKAKHPGSNYKPYDEDEALRKKASTSGLDNYDDINAFVFLNSTENKGMAESLPDYVKEMSLRARMDIISQIMETPKEKRNDEMFKKIAEGAAKKYPKGKDNK